MGLDILVVDDERDIRRLISEILTDEGYTCREAAGSEDALAAINEYLPGLVILDIWLEGSEMDGLAVLEHTLSVRPDIPVIMISGHADIETAVNAIKLGAFDFIEKPFKADRLLLMVDRAIDTARLKRENTELRERYMPDTALVGVSPATEGLRTAINRVAPTNSRVLISGPAGVGKEVVARMLHRRSRRADGPFVVLNCATMAPERMETELFGTEHREGVVSRKFGILEQASGGTLFFDEVADMPLATQGKIVRVLQEQRFCRVGGTRPINVDVRIVSATSRNLLEEISSERFRTDLYYRLSVVPIEIPSLRDRPEDIPPLIEHFMDQASRVSGTPPRILSGDAMATLQSYEWPGNVRQLKNVVDWILIMAAGGADEPLHAEELPPEIGAANPVSQSWDEGSDIMTLPLREAREVFERQYLNAQIKRFGGNVSKTASFVGMERSALHRKLRILGVSGGNRLEETGV